MSKKLGFALGAGGSRGVAHVGFLQAMEENGIKPNYIAGSSMGSVVGAFYAAGFSPAQMKNEVTAVKFNDLFDLSMNVYRNGALLRSNKMHKKLYKYLENKTVDQLNIPYCAVATDLISGNTVTLGEKMSVVTCVQASSSMPGVFKPVSVDGMLLVDGGVKCRVPVQQVRDMGAEVVIAVDALGDIRPANKKYNIISVFTRMVDISDAELTKFKMQSLKPDLYVCPDMGDMVQYKFKEMDRAYDAGYQAGLNCVQQIKQLIED